VTALAALVGAALLTAAITPLSRAAAIRAGAVDKPGGRRLHASDVPRLGGLAIAGSFLCVTVVGAAITGQARLVADNPDAPRLVQGILLGALLAVLVGLVDDLRELSPRGQILGQVAVGLVAVGHGLWLQRFSSPLSGQVVDLRTALGWAGLAVVTAATLVWYVGFINTVNWLDGIDGLAATVGGISAALFAVHMVGAFDQWELAVVPAALAGACLGFLPWNLPPARVFMGSSGSTFLGFALAALALVAPAKVATALLVMWVPIMDVAWQIVVRIRRGQAPWQADRGHLHHRLYDRGWSQRSVVGLYGSIALALGGIAVLLPAGNPNSGVYKIAALGLAGVLTLAGLWHLAREEPV
jgi:UDP-GlcNAc:undecaprenyl-phosphate GlcNAc-1-phosphate transferase